LGLDKELDASREAPPSLPRTLMPMAKAAELRRRDAREEELLAGALQELAR
ncbi:unnamed protein product, partial [Effrenium voratum]